MAMNRVSAWGVRHNGRPCCGNSHAVAAIQCVASVSTAPNPFFPSLLRQARLRFSMPCAIPCPVVSARYAHPPGT